MQATSDLLHDSQYRSANAAAIMTCWQPSMLPTLANNLTPAKNESAAAALRLPVGRHRKQTAELTMPARPRVIRERERGALNRTHRATFGELGLRRPTPAIREYQTANGRNRDQANGGRLRDDGNRIEAEEVVAVLVAELN